MPENWHCPNAGVLRLEEFYQGNGQGRGGDHDTYSYFVHLDTQVCNISFCDFAGFILGRNDRFRLFFIKSGFLQGLHGLEYVGCAHFEFSAPATARIAPVPLLDSHIICPLGLATVWKSVGIFQAPRRNPGATDPATQARSQKVPAPLCVLFTVGVQDHLTLRDLNHAEVLVVHIHIPSKESAQPLLEPAIAGRSRSDPSPKEILRDEGRQQRGEDRSRLAIVCGASRGRLIQNASSRLQDLLGIPCQGVRWLFEIHSGTLPKAIRYTPCKL